MKVVTEHGEDARVCVLRVLGDIDSSTAPELQTALEAAVHCGSVNLVVDLAEVTYADSSALGVIVSMNRMLTPKCGRLVLAGATRDVARILEISGLIGAAPTVSSASDATDALAGLMLGTPAEPPLWTRSIERPASGLSRSTCISTVYSRGSSCELIAALRLGNSRGARKIKYETPITATGSGNAMSDMKSNTVPAGGWSITIANSISCASEGYNATKMYYCVKVCESGYAGATLDMWIRRWMDRYGNQLPYCAREDV